MKYVFEFSSKPGEPKLLTWVHVEAPNMEAARLIAYRRFVEQRYTITAEHTEAKED